MRESTRAFWFLCFGALLSGGCLEHQGGDELESQDPKAPGEVLGYFSLSGRLSEDTCGAENLNAPDKWSFDVKLSRDGSALYWLNGREGIVGEIDKQGQFEFETHIDVKLAEKRGAAKGCTMVRRDAAKGTLSKSEDALSVTLSYGYEATADSDCSEFATGATGQPLALPCRMSYALAGSRIDSD